MLLAHCSSATAAVPKAAANAVNQKCRWRHSDNKLVVEVAGPLVALDSGVTLQEDWPNDVLHGYDVGPVRCLDATVSQLALVPALLQSHHAQVLRLLGVVHLGVPLHIRSQPHSAVLGDDVGLISQLAGWASKGEEGQHFGKPDLPVRATADKSCPSQLLLKAEGCRMHCLHGACNGHLLLTLPSFASVASDPPRPELLPPLLPCSRSRRATAASLFVRYRSPPH